MTQAKMTFASDAFKNAAKNAAASLSGRASNTNTVTQRMGLGDTSKTPSVNTFTSNATNNASQAERQGYANANEALANNPMFKQTQLNDSRNFTEDQRRFNAGLGVKANEQSTLRYQSDNLLSGVRYNADAGVKSTQIGADANRYGADRGLEGSKYSADRGVDVARISADANRFSALLGAGTATLNSQQYRPSFNR